ncbi:MAG: gliding motility-associated protein GldE [Bacteroidia bacterium]
MPEIILIFILFVAGVLISALERAVRLIGQPELEEISRKYNRTFLNSCLRDSGNPLGSFFLGKYISQIGIAVCLLHRMSILNPGYTETELILITLAYCLPVFFLSFFFSRLFVAKASVSLVFTLRWLLFPVYILFLPVAGFYTKLSSYFDKKAGTTQPAISMDELSRALDLTENAQTNPEDHKLLKGIINFGNMDITRIMQPKMDIVAFDLSTPYREIIQRIQESGYSRVPVYRDKLDQIVGVLYIKDLLAHLNEQDNFNWQALLRPCFFIPENMKPDDLLREFQHKKTHLAIVVDEFGQTNGLVTLEDIIEEIVGEINDEFDDDEIAWSKLDDNNYVFEGKISMNDFLRILGKDASQISELKSDSDTLSGFIIERAGHFPKKNEKLNWENFTFNIESADSRRIKRVKVTIRKK